MSSITARKPIRVLLADDHLVVRAGLKALLASQPDIQLVGEAADGRAALALVDRLSPDVVLLDIDMPVMNGLAVLQALVARRSPSRVLILTVYEESEYLATVLQAGAAGYLVKSAADRELVQAIRTVATGNFYDRQQYRRVS